MRGLFAALRTLVLPWGSPVGSPHVVINTTPVPAELVTYYAAGAPETLTAPETVAAVIEQAFDGQGNYSYRALVVDSTAPKKLSCLVEGRVVGGTVGEYARVVLNPNIAGGGVQSAMYLNELFLEANLTTLDVLAAGLSTDTQGRAFLEASGFWYFGPGGGAGADVAFGRSAAQTLAIDGLVQNMSAAGAAPTAETWHAMTLLASWVNQGAPRPNAQYRLVPSPYKSVELVGAISGGTRTDGTTIATLPAGYRPSHTVTNVVYCSTTTAGGQSPAFNVDSSGNVQCFGLGASTVNFNFTVPLDA